MDRASIIRALSIRQPYAERILRGTKRVEYRSRPANIRGRVCTYASMTPGGDEDFARMHAQPGDFPVGVLVGTDQIADCTGEAGDYQWHLATPERLPETIKPTNHPDSAWFCLFRRESVGVEV